MATKASKSKAKSSRLTKALLKTADDMRKSGLLTKAAHEKITMRHAAVAPVSKVSFS
jgi:putative transcriptional regulator